MLIVLVVEINETLIMQKLFFHSCLVGKNVLALLHEFMGKIILNQKGGDDGRIWKL